MGKPLPTSTSRLADLAGHDPSAECQAELPSAVQHKLSESTLADEVPLAEFALVEAHVLLVRSAPRRLVVEAVARGLDALANAGPTWIHALTIPPRALAELFNLALATPRHTRLVQGLIRAHNLVDLVPEHANDNWPYPVRIFALSRFTLLVEGIQVRFASKAQRRPLELLKAILAFGGRDVPEQKLTDALWPEADADASERALTITLHRLRRMLGQLNVIERRGRTLTLDPRYVWVDAWAFERGLARAQSKTGNERIEELAQALCRYQRPFLWDECAAWAVLPRERLRWKTVSRLFELCQLLEGPEHARAVANLYLAMIDAEPGEERLYVRLMFHYARSQDLEGAVAVYRRGLRALASAGTAPSPNLEAAYRLLWTKEEPGKVALPAQSVSA
jgi:LuxR family transcriptional regulator, maltose regulon positive regulatory protein